VIGSLVAALHKAAPNAVINLPNNAPGNVNVSLKQGLFIGFDTANWRTAASPATYLLVAIPQGPLNSPTGLATLATLLMDRPSLPALSLIKSIHPFLTGAQLNNPLFLAFFAATYDRGSGVYTPLANSIQFSGSSVFSARIPSRRGPKILLYPLYVGGIESQHSRR
jgi:hypothetical protein